MSTPKSETDGVFGRTGLRVEVVLIEADDEFLGLEPEAVV